MQGKRGKAGQGDLELKPGRGAFVMHCLNRTREVLPSLCSFAASQRVRIVLCVLPRVLLGALLRLLGVTLLL